MSTGAELIAAERRRQIDGEGWTPQHDANHSAGELLDAATAYLNTASALAAGIEFDNPPDYWPWAEAWWKPGTDPVRALVKAGALIAAEIDRLTGAVPAPEHLHSFKWGNCSTCGAVPAPEEQPITHLCTISGAATTPCCDKTPFELPDTDRMTKISALVTCGRPLPDGERPAPEEQQR